MGRQDLNKALEGDVHTLSIAELLPVVDFFVENDVDHLLQAFENRQRDLLSLSHEVALRFAREYFDLEQLVGDAQKGGQGQLPQSAEDIERSQSAIKVQSFWRGSLEQKRFNQRLMDTVFEEPSTPRTGGPASWLRPSQRSLTGATDTEPPLTAGFGERVRSVRAVRSNVSNIIARLALSGLDAAAAFRSADTDYPNSRGSISMGQFLTMLSRKLHALRQPGEVSLLLRLLEIPGRRKVLQTAPALTAAEVPGMSLAALPSTTAGLEDSAGGSAAGLMPSLPPAVFQTPLAYKLAAELDVAFPVPGDACAAAARAASGIAKASVVALHDSLVALELVPLRCGKKKPTWRRLLLDAHVTLLMEEHARLEKLLDIACRSGKPIVSQLRSQLAICGAQLAAAGKPWASPRVAVPVLIAYLLGKEMQLPPVTVHAGVLTASEPSKERRTARVKVTLGSEQLVVFPLPLPAAPQMLHLTALKDTPGLLCTISLENLSESGMVLQVTLADKEKETETDKQRRCARLRLHYRAGTASGTINIGPSGNVEVKFMPRLLRCPGFVHIESFETDRNDNKTAAAAQSRIHAKSWIDLKRPTASGFALGMPAGQAIDRRRIRVWYEAIFKEATVSVASVSSFCQRCNIAVLEDLGEAERQKRGGLDEDAVALAKILPEPQPLQINLSLDADPDESEDLEGDAGDDEDTEDEVEGQQTRSLMSKMNERVHELLQQKSTSSTSAPAATLTAPAGYSLSEPATLPPTPAAPTAPVPDAPQPPAVPMPKPEPLHLAGPSITQDKAALPAPAAPAPPAPPAPVPSPPHPPAIPSAVAAPGVLIEPKTIAPINLGTPSAPAIIAPPAPAIPVIPESSTGPAGWEYQTGDDVVAKIALLVDGTFRGSSTVRSAGMCGQGKGTWSLDGDGKTLRFADYEGQWSGPGESGSWDADAKTVTLSKGGQTLPQKRQLGADGW